MGSISSLITPMNTPIVNTPVHGAIITTFSMCMFFRVITFYIITAYRRRLFRSIHNFKFR